MFNSNFLVCISLYFPKKINKIMFPTFGSNYLENVMFEKVNMGNIMLLCVTIGRYEDEFIQERMRQLSMWIDRMCKHPIVAKSEVFNHFLTCTDEKVCYVAFCLI